MNQNSNRPFEEKPNWKEKLSESLPFLSRLFKKNERSSSTNHEGTLTNVVKTQLLQQTQAIRQKFSKKPSPPPFPGGETQPDLSHATFSEKIKDSVTRIFNRSNLQTNGTLVQSPTSLKLNQDSILFLLTLLSILFLTYLAADLIAYFIEKYIPEPPVASLKSRSNSIDPNLKLKSLSDYQVIISRNLFNNRGLIPGDQMPGSPSDLNNVPIKTTLPFNLIGTLVLKNELRSIATIEDKNDSQVYPVRIDDEIPGKVKIISIEPLKVVFINKSSGRREFVDLPENSSGGISLGGSKISVSAGGGKGTGIEQLAPGTYNVSRSEIDKALADMSKILTDARAIPHVENGVPSGFKLIQIVPGSIYSKLGLKDEDVLCGVDGEPINDPGKAYELLASLKTRTALDLCVKRGGKTNNFNYNIK